MARKENAQKDRKGYRVRQRALQTLELDEVIAFFTAYLNDEVTIEIEKQNPPKRKNRHKRAKQSAPAKQPVSAEPLQNETDILLASIAIIGERIILKYCKGQHPHYDRMSIWEMSLLILDEMVTGGIIGAVQEFSLTKNGYTFQ